MLTRTQKKSVAVSLAKLIKSARGFVLVNYHGLTMKEIGALKRKARVSGVSYKTAKKTLLKRALHTAGIGSIDPTKIQGDIAMALSDTDAVAPVKLMSELGRVWKRTDLLKIGLVDGALLDADALQKIAKLPSLQVIRAQVLRAMLAPVQGLVLVLNGVTRKFVMTVDAVRASKQP